MKGLSYKWLVMMVVIFGLFMVMLDLTIINIAIPNLQADFGASLTDIAWVATGYALAEGIGIPLTPYFSALLGNKRFYLLILASFTVGSTLCGLAWSLPALIAFRIFQGLAGACMIPMSITLLYTEFAPEERGVALGSLGVPLMVAPALGPTIGGYLVTFVSWRVIFYVNVPVGILGLIMGSLLLRNNPPARQRPTFDLGGFFFSTVGLGSLLYAFDKAGDKGWTSFTVLSFLTIGLVCLVIFVIVELLVIQRGKQPLLDLRIFKSRSFAGGNICMMTIAFALFGGQYLIPQYLQLLRGLSAYDAGIVMLPQALGSMAASLIGGRLVDRIGVKAVVIPGLLILGTALWGFASLTEQTPLSHFQLLLMIRGLGIGLSMQPTTVAALAEIGPAQLSQASSLNSVVRSVGTSFAVALVSTLVTARTVFHSLRLAELVRPDNAAGQMLQQEAGYLMSQGQTQQNAMMMAIGGAIRHLQLQSYMLAINDAFLVTLGAILFTILIVVFVVRAPRRKKAGALPKNEHMALEGPLMEEPKISNNSESSFTEPLVTDHQEESEVYAAKEEPAMDSYQKSTPSVAEEELAVISHQRSAVAVADGEPIMASYQRSTVAVAEPEPIVLPRPRSANGKPSTAPLQENVSTQEPKKDTPKRGILRRSVIIPVIIALVFIGTGLGGWLVYNNYNFYSTDDAQVTGTLVPIVSPISGTLISLNAEVGSQVSAKEVIGTVQPTGPLPVQHLTAPVDGVIVQTPGAIGQLVSPSTMIAQEVDPTTVKITAYVDESAIKNIAQGQTADIHVDAYNSTITGHVSQIVEATAGQFSLLPTSDNSSGNFTKVTQRIPVNIAVDEATDGSLVPGMSVEVTIHLH